MRIAVTYENGNVFQHFGKTSQFKCYDIEDNEIKESQIIDTKGHSHGALAIVLSSLNVDLLICGNIGKGAMMALAGANIKVIGGASGDCDEALKDYLQGTLETNPDFQCNCHHE